MPEVIALVEDALRRQNAGATIMPPKAALRWREGAGLWAMPGYVPGNAAAMKWVGSVEANPARALPQTFAVIVLADEDTGLPVAVMDGTWVTNMRTGAVSAIAARLLVADAAAPLALIGCGAQMRTQVIALATVLKPSQVRVHARRSERVEQFIAEMRHHIDAEWRYCERAEVAVRNAGTVVTATRLYRPPQPIVREPWLAPGVLALPVDVQGAYDPSVYAHLDKFICDTWEGVTQIAGDGAFPKGTPKLHGELHEVLCGIKPGRDNARERIMAMNAGMAIEDVVVANAVLARALRQNVGTTLDR
jgi:ornithine cyclodeaminase/alanine dehydrogenase-like protein (mu-crystallin family)